jgi:hypothetical protein
MPPSSLYFSGFLTHPTNVNRHPVIPDANSLLRSVETPLEAAPTSDNLVGFLCPVHRAHPTQTVPRREGG